MIVAFVNPEGILTALLPGEEPSTAQVALAALLSGAELVPVTGLDEEGLLEVPAAFTSWQVLGHGAVVLTPDGEEDPAWRRLTAETLEEYEGALRLAHQAAQHIGWLGQLGTEAHLHERHGRPLMATLTHPHHLTHALAAAAREWRTWLDESPFRGRLRLIEGTTALTMLPREINPESAVNYVLSQLGDVTLTLGASAAPSDAAFLALCDYALTPGGGPVLEAAQAALGGSGEGEDE
ncbi:hypothetical protein DAETH_34860 (plasmid) [Deinococcus aetherius]|uniref:Uncharacterized protein n=1 Tax=Deinococcus aetherius TaxID=200252 RepID=A0ABM8AIJ9_9DEIO|nr:hypothetical protein [Deinococcus aetherius]BDP43517.1 hypothetical protein DAETH_34860 [Deinococcus aetherius]